MAACGTTALRASNHSRAPFSSSGAQGCSGSDVLTGTFMPASHHTHTPTHTGTRTRSAGGTRQEQVRAPGAPVLSQDLEHMHKSKTHSLG